MRTYYIVLDDKELSFAAESGLPPQERLTDNPTACYVIKTIQAHNYDEAKKRFENWVKTPKKIIKIPRSTYDTIKGAFAEMAHTRPPCGDSQSAPDDGRPNDRKE